MKSAPAKRSLGQNFLVAKDIIETIGNAVPDNTPLLLEIGPGQGAISSILAKKAKTFCLVEKDEKLLAGTKTKLYLEGNQNIHTWDIDILDFDLHRLWSETATPNNVPLVIIANLPYNIATEILVRLIYFSHKISFMLLMFQKEVAQRIAAEPNSKKYGSLSVFTQIFFETKIIKMIPPKAFQPRPQVDSALVLFKKRTEPLLQLDDKQLESFQNFVRSCFAHRRKTIANSLALSPRKLPWQQILATCQIDSKRRAETISIAEYGKLFFELENYESKI